MNSHTPIAQVDSASVPRARSNHLTIFFFAVALLFEGCGSGSPLVGTWGHVSSQNTVTLTGRLLLGTDGSASFTTTGTDACSGAVSVTGVDWSSDASMITFSGTPTCAGVVSCMVAGGPAVTYGCDVYGDVPPIATCSYALTDSDNFLTVDNCGGSSGVLLQLSRM